MIQDIEPFSFENEFGLFKPEDKDYIFWLKKGTFAVQKGSEDFLTAATLRGMLDGDMPQVHFVCRIDTTRYFVTTQDDAMEKLLAEDKLDMLEVKNLRKWPQMWKAFGAVTVRHVDEWYRKNVFCGRCGRPLVHSNRERAMECPCCKNVVYPTIAPAVIVAITDGDRILLTRYAASQFKNYSLVAGYAEIGETFEDTVRREVMEEVGLRVKNIRYYKSQPWGFSGSLLAGFYCELDGCDQVTLQESELAVGKWFARGDAPDKNFGLSLTNEMISVFAQGKDKEYR